MSALHLDRSNLPDYPAHLNQTDLIAQPKHNYGGSSLYLNGSSSLTDALWEVMWRGQERYQRKDYHLEAFLSSDVTESIDRGRFFRSPKGYLGITKIGAELLPTDLICILLGANVPFILRKVDEHYILISDAYVEGLMYGEAIGMMREGVLAVETINIC